MYQKEKKIKKTKPTKKERKKEKNIINRYKKRHNKKKNDYRTLSASM